MPTKLINIVIFLNLALVQVICINTCNMKISDDRMSVFKTQTSVFDSGVLNEDRYGIHAPVPYVANLFTDIDYLYSLELNTNNNTNYKEPVKMLFNLDFSDKLK